MRRWGLFFLTVWGLKLHGRTNRLFLSHNDVCHDTNTSAFGCWSPWMKLPASDGLVMPQRVVTLWADDSPCVMPTAQQSCNSLCLWGGIIIGGCVLHGAVTWALGLGGRNQELRSPWESDDLRILTPLSLCCKRTELSDCYGPNKDSTQINSSTCTVPLMEPSQRIKL